MRVPLDVYRLAIEVHGFKGSGFKVMLFVTDAERPTRDFEMLKIEELSKKHNRTEFDCGVQALNQYLRNTAKKYPDKVPGAKLARLAVSRKHQYQGLGKYMLVNAIERVLLVSKNIRITGFFVDATHVEAKRYYEQFGFMSLPDNHLQLFLPLTKLQQAYATVLRQPTLPSGPT